MTFADANTTFEEVVGGPESEMEDDLNGTSLNEEYQNPMDNVIVKGTLIALYTLVFVTCFIGKVNFRQSMLIVAQIIR